MRLNLVRSIALFGFFAGASILSIIKADAQQRPALREHAVVSGDVVTLGDLITDAGIHAGRALFRAPRIGDRGTIQANRVIAAAQEAGLGEIDMRGLQQITVERAVRRVSRQEIEQAVVHDIADRVRADPRDLTLTFDTDVTILQEKSANSGLAVSELVIDSRLRRFTARLSAKGSSVADGKSVRVSGAYGETILVPVLVRGLQKGDAVHESDFQLERRERESASDDPVIDAKVLMGRVARNAMRPGVVLRDRDLVKPIVVERNAVINMQLDVPGIHVTMKGKAMEQGSIGELISVQNINSKRIVQGIVVGSNQVRIGATAAAVSRTANASR